MNTRG